MGARPLLWAMVLLAPLVAARAVTVTSASPQGEVAQAAQVVLRFSAPVVPLGDLRQPDPAEVSCAPATPAGSGRWNSDREWVFDFRAPLPPGRRCTVALRADWRPAVAAAGAPTGTTRFAFSTGGPAVVAVQPWPGGEVEEDAHFLVTLNGPAVEAGLEGRAGCEVEGLGDRIPVRVVGGAARDALLKARRIADPARAARTLLLACGRPLPNGARVRLVWGEGIASRDDPAVITRLAQRFDFRVRDAFSAEFSCERERANAPCVPVRPLTLSFSAPVARTLAAAVRLEGPGGRAIAPSFGRDERAEELVSLRFAPPFAERAGYRLVLPPGLQDTSGRPLANAASFPLAVATAEAPPIAKFAAAPFGVVERFAEPGGAVLPLTLRRVQDDLRAGAAGGQVRIATPRSDAEVLAWFRRLKRHHETLLPARELGLPREQWTVLETDTDARGRSVTRRVERLVATREVSLLAGETQARRLALPVLEGGDPRPFEVIGVPLPGPGFHVVEVESQRLGAALLGRTAPMYVRTGVLVTNLGVHFKRGRESSAVWVTTLDRGRPVEGAEVAVHDCAGKTVWTGRTDAAGLARIAAALDPGRCDDEEAMFVTARKADARGGGTDMAFVFSDWQRGIEPWRFELPTSMDPEPELRAHTVFDRTLLRAGETVSMKHFVRRQHAGGLAPLDAARLPDRVKIVHEGSGDELTLPLVWSGTRHASSSWRIPPAAKLGSYRVALERSAPAAEGARTSWLSGEFRVEAFRVPLVDARLAAASGSKAPFVAPAELVLDAQLNHLSGGAVAGAPLTLSALLQPRGAGFAGHEGFSFAPPQGERETSPEEDEGGAPPRPGRLVADKLAATTSREGAARFTLRALPKIDRPSEIVAELGFADPNGERQTVATTLPLWPAAVVPGVRAPSSARAGTPIGVTALALDTEGRPRSGQALELHARLRQLVSTRKRIVGGFYAYEHRVEHRDLGRVCSGRSDAQGRLACEARLEASGEVEFIASAADDAGRVATAAASTWLSGDGELWFAQGDDDRIDLLPEQRRVEPGGRVRLQVRMPYRQATALVTVEREGVIDARVVALRGSDPTVELKVDPAWAPNVYVSVLVLRGRLREVPWYSFFTWGWREPLEWARAFWYEGREVRPPTALVDLAKPSFKLGVAQLEVGSAAHRLDVALSTDKTQYAVREKVRARIKVTHGGRPAAGAEIAFAAVDEGLLALRDNASWDLLAGMLQPRAWGVETSTAQGEIVGRRHYGRKAVAAGGGGGRGGTRELFDTLLLWRAQVVLDANGEATVEVPLNDSLSSFRLVAIADDGGARFGTGQASVRVTQDLQLLPGLPPLVREGDRFEARVTLRNTTARAMTVRAALAGRAGGEALAETPLALAPQQVQIAAGAAAELAWTVDVPAGAERIAWDGAADELGAPAGSAAAQDRVRLVQTVAPAVPLRTLQATLLPLDGRATLPLAPPADALRSGRTLRGGVVVALQPKLSSALPGLRRFFEGYPYVCLEQQFSKAVGLRDAAAFARLAESLPAYLDDDGLAGYFPPAPGDAARGSDRLTAYLLAAAHEAGFAWPAPLQERMLQGLAAFVEGRIERRFWAPRADLDVRRLAAFEALARHGRANPRALSALTIAPAGWPTAALIDWLQILRRVDALPERARRLQEAQQALRGRLAFAGTTLRFADEDGDFWWWLMDSADANAARLILAVLDDPAWRDELPRLVTGHLARAPRGAWLTTTANAWSALALDRFGERFESVAVAGRTQLTSGGESMSLDWASAPGGGQLKLGWPEPAGALEVRHEGSGRPWLTVQALAAVPLKAPLAAGYTVTRRIAAVERRDPQRWSRGDIVRVRLELEAAADRTWVVLADPVPAGAALLGGGLGRDSALATRASAPPAGESRPRPAFEERGFGQYRATFEHLPRGRHVVEYTLRLNNAGRFVLPPTRIEAMYAPETFGEVPNEAWEVAP